MTVLELLATAAGAGIVAADLWTDLHRFLPDGAGGGVVVFAAAFLGDRPGGRCAIAGVACSVHFVLAHPQLAHVRSLFAAFPDAAGGILVGMVDTAVTEEADNILVDLAVHSPEQF